MGGYDISKWKDLVNSELSMSDIAMFTCLSISQAIVKEETRG